MIKRVAGIDIGSNALRMLIAEINDLGEIVPLEELKRSTNIGRDSFASGRISVETIQETCNILSNFKKIMDEYEVHDYLAAATSGLREAENKEYILEQIRLRTGLKINIVNSAEERFLTFKAIQDYLPDYNWMKEKGLLIVDIGSGGVEISIYSKGNLQFTDYSKVGSLRLSEALSDLESTTLFFPKVMEEFIDSKIHLLKPMIESLGIEYFIGLGGELRRILNLPICSGEEKFIKREVLEKLYQHVNAMSTDQMIDEFDIDYHEARILLPSVIIFNYFFHLTRAEGIYAPLVSLRHGLVAHLFDKYNRPERDKVFEKDIVRSVKFLAEKYRIDIKHAEMVENLALDIFDQSKNIHHLGDRARLYLQVAAILHDVGKFINKNMHTRHSFTIISSQNIIGFSDRELQITANIARYHEGEVPQPYHSDYKSLNFKDRMIVSKLVAILRIANALDISYKHKCDYLNVRGEDRNLIFEIKSDDDLLLEKWAFQKHVDYFYEVLGYNPKLKLVGGFYGIR